MPKTISEKRKSSYDKGWHKRNSAIKKNLQK